MKKVTGKGAKFHYRGRKPEFVTMSRRPGIGSGYFDEFKDEIYPLDEVVPSVGRPASLPLSISTSCLNVLIPLSFLKLKKRSEGIDFYTDPNSTDTRLATRERIKGIHN